MIRNVFFAALGCAMLVAPPALSAEPALEPGATFEPTPESLQQWSTPEWFRDAKLGVFIHWGPYAVPAYGSEWYPRRMYQEFHTTPKNVVDYDRKEPVFEHHRKVWGDQKQFGYKDFIPKFKAENWDPGAWVDLFRRAGVKYVVPVAEHHDGFAMYDSSLTPWNAVERGPHRDIVGDLASACREAGLRFGVSSHHAFNWRYYTYKDDFDTTDPENASLYSRPHEWEEPADQQFLDHWYARTKEIIDRYQPEVLWFDFGFNYPEFTDHRTRLAAYYYNHGLLNGQEVVLQYKNLNWNPFPEGAALLDIERGKLSGIRELPWQTDTSVSKKSWGYIEGDEFKSSDDLIDDLIDIVSKNGCLLLNVGPRADGTIPEQAQNVLLDIGAWLDEYGEAIYGSRPWKTFGEGPTEVASGHYSEKDNTPLTSRDFRFTQKDGAVYVLGMAWPEGPKVRVESLGKQAGLLEQPVESVTLVGSDAAIDWSQDDAALTVAMPQRDGRPPAAYALRIRLAK